MRRLLLLAAILGFTLINTGCILNMYSPDPNERMQQMLNQSEDLRQMRNAIARGTTPTDFETKLRKLAAGSLLHRSVEQHCRLFIALLMAAHDGASTAIRPSHTMWDGDTAFALATGQVEARQAEVEAMASDAVAQAIRRAVLLATGVPNFPAVREIREGRLP